MPARAGFERLNDEPNAEIAITKKRADYFAARGLVFWEVDLLSPDVTKSYSCKSFERMRYIARSCCIRLMRSTAR